MKKKSKILCFFGYLTEVPGFSLFLDFGLVIRGKSVTQGSMGREGTLRIYNLH